MVCPTLSWKYWLTKPEPGVADVREEQYSAPTASTTRTTAAGLRPGLSISAGRAGMVATVADPVASRMSTASSHASTMTEMLTSLAQSASRLIPLSTSTC